MALTGGEKRDPGSAADASEGSPSPDQGNSEVMTPELEVQQEYEERIRDLLKAYQETLETVEDLPAVVWVLLDRKVPGSYFRVPYLRGFLKYFVVHHIEIGA